MFFDLAEYYIKGKIVGFQSIQQPPDCPIRRIFFGTEQAHNDLEWHLDNLEIILLREIILHYNDYIMFII